MKNMILKDTLRKVWATKGRFFAIMAIIAISCGFFAGVKSTCPNMKDTADIYYINQNLMDIKLMSTVGFDDENIETLKNTEGVTQLYAGYSADFFVDAGGGSFAIMKTLSFDFDNVGDAINKPVLLSGRYPVNEHECVVGLSTYNPSNMQEGNKIKFLTNDSERDIDDILDIDEFDIVGIVKSPQYISFERGSTSIGNGALDGFVLLPQQAYAYEAYTEVYLKCSDFDGVSAFIDDYDDICDSVVERYEDIGDELLEARVNRLTDEANEELDDAKKEYNDGKKEYDDNYSKYLTETADARAELEDGRKEYNDGLDEYNAAAADYDTIERMSDEEFAKLSGLPSDVLSSIKDEYIEAAHEELIKAKADLDDAYKEIMDGKQELSDSKAEAKQEFADAKKKLDDAQKEYDENYEKYLAEISDAEKSISDGKEKYNEGIKAYSDGKAKLAYIEMMTDEQFAMMNNVDISEAAAAKKYALYKGHSELQTAYAELEKANTQLVTASTELNKQKQEAERKFADAKRDISNGRYDYRSEYRKYTEEIADAEKELADGISEYNDGLDEYKNAQADILRWENIDAEQFAAEVDLPAEDAAETRQKVLDEMREELDDAKQELDDAYIELSDGEKEFADETADAEKEFADAREELNDGEIKIADAEKEIADLKKDSKLYVFDRSVNPDYANYRTDAERIDKIAVVFPIFFILVAALVCLTTMTRMIEEQRTEIGTLKALGYGRRTIIGQYVGYAVTASVLGGIIGLSVGFVLFPKVIYNAYSMLYNIPDIITPFRMNYAVGCIAAAVVCTGLSAFISCYRELISLPAQLMRPRPPKDGKRVLLERITPIWNKLSFTTKVTIRNLSRYKGRVLMTVIGVAGCTALLVTGFCLKYSIGSIVDKQYGSIFIYDAMVILNDSADTEEYTDACERIENNDAVESSMKILMKNIRTANGKKNVDCYVAVPQDNASLGSYISLHERIGGKELILDDESVIINEKLAKLLSVKEGDSILLGEDEKEVTISGITENYTMNYVYISASLYESMFGTYTNNSCLINFNESFDKDSFSEEMLEDGNIIEISFSSSANNKFADVLGSLDSVIYVIILSAASLALVVLYNLTNINVNERIRELATIKVLGFYDIETASFIYRENAVSTFMGIVCGLGLGMVLKEFVISTSEVDLVMFARDMPLYTLLYSVALTVVFALIVNITMYRRIKRIDMAASMKAIE